MDIALHIILKKYRILMEFYIPKYYIPIGELQRISFIYFYLNNQILETSKIPKGLIPKSNLLYLFYHLIFIQTI